AELGASRASPAKTAVNVVVVVSEYTGSHLPLASTLPDATSRRACPAGVAYSDTLRLANGRARVTVIVTWAPYGLSVTGELTEIGGLTAATACTGPALSATPVVPAIAGAAG